MGHGAMGNCITRTLTMSPQPTYAPLLSSHHRLWLPCLSVSLHSAPIDLPTPAHQFIARRLHAHPSPISVLQAAAPGEDTWAAVAPANLQSSGYSTEESRNSIVKDMVKMKFSIIMQGGDEAKMYDQVAAMATAIPSWAPHSLSADLHHMHNLLQVRGAAPSASDVIEAALAAHSSIDSGLHEICSYILSWPNGRRAVDKLKQVALDKKDGARAQKECQTLFEALAAQTQDSSPELDGSESLKLALESITQASAIYTDAGPLTIAYLKLHDEALADFLGEVQYLFASGLAARGATTAANHDWILPAPLALPPTFPRACFATGTPALASSHWHFSPGTPPLVLFRKWW